MSVLVSLVCKDLLRKYFMNTCYGTKQGHHIVGDRDAEISAGVDYPQRLHHEEPDGLVGSLLNDCGADTLVHPRHTLGRESA